MADNLLLPVCIDRILDSNGDPVSGAKVYVYDAGTTDEKNVFTDDDLNTAADNPIVADSGGYIPSRFIGTGAYKLVIKTSADVTIKTEDNLPGALDTSSFDSDEATPVTPVISKTSNYTVLEGDQGKVIDSDPTGGSFTLTLPSAVTVGDDWRVTAKHTGTANSVTLSATGGQTIDGSTTYVLNFQHEAVTLVSDGANWHITESGRVHIPVLSITPQGRLTLTSGTPVLSSDAASQTTVYYTPYTGNLLPFYNGQRFLPEEFSELSLTLVSQHEASGIYDVFGFKDGTTQRIGTGPKWSTVTAGSGARGTGAGTTELERVAGLLVNKEDITLRNGTSTYSVDANKATYLGSIFIDTNAGQVTCHLSFGQSRKFGVWNAYNRVPIILKAGDTTASWAYSTDTVRASNNDSTNKATVLSGLAEEIFDLSFTQKLQVSSGSIASAIGIGWNATNAFSGLSATWGSFGSSSANGSVTATHIQAPAIGINDVQSLETGNGSATSTFHGGNDDMQLVARWMG